jgi:predicted CopG family antitoxin
MSNKTNKISISEQVYDKLKMIKKRNGHTTIDSVIRYLLERSGEGLGVGRLDVGACEYESSGRICRIKMSEEYVEQQCDEEKWWLCKLRTEYLQNMRKKTRR